jgi:hypothetical protein
MSARLAAFTLLLLALVTPAAAHRVDEYLQAVLLSVEKDEIKADLYLTPGVTVLPAILAAIDADGDGLLSEAEQRVYAARVLTDLVITLDGQRLTPVLTAATFPRLDDLKEGLGDIHLEFKAALPRGKPARQLRLENTHQAAIAVYQVNCLVSRGPEIQIGREHRSVTQAVYELEYVQAEGRQGQGIPPENGEATPPGPR